MYGRFHDTHCKQAVGYCEPLVRDMFPGDLRGFHVKKTLKEVPCACLVVPGLPSLYWSEGFVLKWG